MLGDSFSSKLLELTYIARSTFATSSLRLPHWGLVLASLLWTRFPAEFPANPVTVSVLSLQNSACSSYHKSETTLPRWSAIVQQKRVPGVSYEKNLMKSITMTIEEGDAFHALLVMNLHCQFARKSDAPAETLRWNTTGSSLHALMKMFSLP